MAEFTALEPTPARRQRLPVVMTGDPAAAAFRRRVRLIDQVARTLISISGVSIIGAVLGIGLFLLLEIFPLFQGARLTPGIVQPVLSSDQPARLIVIDEQQERVGVLGQDPVLRLFSLARRQPPELVPIPGLEGERVSAVSRVIRDPQVAIGTEQGTLWTGTIQFVTQFTGSQRRVQAIVEPDFKLSVASDHRITQLAFRTAGEQSVAASVIDGTQLLVTRITTQRPLGGPVQHTQESARVLVEPLGHPTGVLLNESGTQLLVGTSHGLLARWGLPAQGPAELIETVPAVPGGCVTTMTYMLGNRSVAVGGSDGSVATWSLVRDDRAADGWRLRRIHPFPQHASTVTVIAASPRDKGLISVSADGVARLHYMTSERTLWQFLVPALPTVLDMAPKANGAVLVDHTGQLHHWLIDNPHPEISWRALFGKLWYEGYQHPDYIWQSSGGTDDFEPKLSLVPLVFGTLKGTCYALLFAVPLALFGALYCSQFLDKRLRNPIKSAIELMAALPSVVLGFVAGVVLAPLVQNHIVSVLILPVAVPAVSVGGLALWRRLSSATAGIHRGEFWILAAGVVLGIMVAVWVGPVLERIVCGGHFEGWLLRATGMRYDQRNSLIVGWAMGFAVIPIIFTICEDAFSAVPKHLVGASLACGASAWQTAWRVVLPAAGSGVFSAIMVGFGRAVGETMIVLMATGNTPILDWSIFNGFRALSANIAVEIPEAPYGGTLYRVLFVAALVLFAMTFVVNTAAELVRLHLRRQLQGL